MEGSQQFRLKWNNYHVNIANSFDSLRVDEDFVDVTVACDGFQTKAHRMVLSACSPYFRDLLKSNPHPHPIVILRDVSQRNIQLMLDYMYHGEVNVAQAQLADFLKVAEMLKVKGLADDRAPDTAADINGRPESVWPRPGSPAADAPPEKRRRASPAAVRPVKEEPPERPGRPDPQPEPLPLSEPEPELMPEQELELKRESQPDDRLSERLLDSPPADLSTGQSVAPGPSSGAGYDTGQDSPLTQDPISRPAAPRRASCPICGRWFQKGSHLREHVASIHYPVPSRCELCGKLLRSKASLRTHLIKYHRRVERPPAGKVERGPVPAADGLI